MDETTQTRTPGATPIQQATHPRKAPSEPRPSEPRKNGARDADEAAFNKDTAPAKDPDVTAKTQVTDRTNGASDGDGFETHWREIKAGFVDDPRQSVEQADALVDEALKRITTRHRALLDHWKNGDERDTETLRRALRDYHTLLLQLTGK
ncbi:hypothetical protein ACFHYQ_00480 [Sphaerimonospora cavernae]|uniref:Uncharacterized protein n=1 Tax=Sphaerimonospora cavernae TaxID=1740611 RepID=A0ABV6TX51_9ACTN